MGIRFHNVAISASAGAGKTFQLTNRFIALLAAGVPPERVVGMTFTRLAAGEIFDKVVARLAEATASDAAAAKLSQELRTGVGTDFAGGADLGRAETIGLLRCLVRSMHLCRIGTIDSFLVGILQAFPYEFGLAGDFEIVEESAAAAVRRDVLRRVFLVERSTAADQAFLEEFKQATFGREEKGVSRLLAEFIDSHHARYLEAPRAALWGAALRIWPEGCPWQTAAAVTRQAHAAALRDGFLPTLPANSRRGWTDLVDLLERFEPGDSLVDVLGGAKPLSRLLQDLDVLAAGDLPYNTKILIAAESCQHLLALVRHVVACELQARLHRTQGVHALLAKYEQQYQRTVRRARRLQFSDISFLLALGPGAGGNGAEDAETDDEAAVNRLHIDFRLDGQFDHWLLDEFQDTSTQQWACLRNLLDEALQDGEGRRSVFFVGDVKQAIYGWREGDSELFGWVRETYRDTLQEGSLTKSWRSSPAVIEAVNRVFDGLTPAGSRLPEAVVRRWQENWGRHLTAKKELTGYAALYRVPVESEADRTGREARLQATAQLIGALDPLSRGHTVAVLVRANEFGRDVVTCLRSHGIGAIMEGRSPVADNPVAAGILSLLKGAAHPGDTLARRHVEMTPLGRHPAAGAGPWAGCLEVMDRLHGSGFEAAVTHCGHALEGAGALDAYGRYTIAELTEAARQFDESASRDVDEFIDFVQGYSLRHVSRRDAVTVMTFHAAKGLEFDMVVLPDLQPAQGITARGPSGLQLCKEHSVARRPQWVLEMPPKDIALADPVLGEFWREAAERTCYEELCNLYVAMTRPRRGLYMLITATNPGEGVLRPSELLELRMSGAGAFGPAGVEGLPGFERLFACGDEKWIGVPAAPGKDAVLAEPAAVLDGASELAGGPRRRIFRRRRPSDVAEKGVDAGVLFNLQRRRGVAFGSAVHDIFHRLAWAEGEAVAQAVRDWRATAAPDDDLAAAAERTFRAALRSPQLASLLAPPDREDIELWREKGFEAIVDGYWVTGVFDRVHVVRDAEGRVIRGTIIDFKTNRVDGETERNRAAALYRPQMELYRRVLAILLGVPAAGIETVLAFTHDGSAVPVHGENPVDRKS